MYCKMVVIMKMSLPLTFQPLFLSKRDRGGLFKLKVYLRVSRDKNKKSIRRRYR